MLAVDVCILRTTDGDGERKGMTFVHRSAAATERRSPNEALHCSRILPAAVLHAGRAMQLLPDDGNISYRLELCFPVGVTRGLRCARRPSSSV